MARTTQLMNNPAADRPTDPCACVNVQGGAFLQAGGARGAGGRGGDGPVRDVPVEGAQRPGGRGGDVPGGHRGRAGELAPRGGVRALPVEHGR
jgi:hypothetical protein